MTSFRARAAVKLVEFLSWALSHSVLVRATSKIMDSRRYVLRTKDGRTDFVCSA